jgi:hypothetical protein
MRTQVELPDDVAVELAGSQDAVLRALQAHLDCKVFLVSGSCASSRS